MGFVIKNALQFLNIGFCSNRINEESKHIRSFASLTLSIPACLRITFSSKCSHDEQDIELVQVSGCFHQEQQTAESKGELEAGQGGKAKVEEQGCRNVPLRGQQTAQHPWRPVCI